MTTIIQWCNQNPGFVNAILAFLGLLLSSIAIVVSIYTARLPYKKKLLLSASAYASNRYGPGLCISVTNVGNRPVQLTTIAFQVGNEQKFNCFNIKAMGDYQGRILKTSELLTIYYDISNIQHIQKKIKEHDFKDNIYIYAKDTEGTEYRKFFLTREQFLNYKG